MGGKPQPDPSLEQQQQLALNNLVAQDQRLTQSDMSSLMARYGSRLAGSPLIAALPVAQPGAR